MSERPQCELNPCEQFLSVPPPLADRLYGIGSRARAKRARGWPWNDGAGGPPPGRYS